MRVRLLMGASKLGSMSMQLGSMAEQLNQEM